MQTKVSVALALGFIMGLGLASCSTVESSRSVASETHPHFDSSDEHHDKVECRVGEERNEDGDCERTANFDHPFRRGGR